jgi:hypothetical protein
VFDVPGRIEQFVTHAMTSEEQHRIGDRPRGLGNVGWLDPVDTSARLADLSKQARSVGYDMESLGTICLTDPGRGTRFFLRVPAPLRKNERRFEGPPTESHEYDPKVADGELAPVYDIPPSVIILHHKRGFPPFLHGQPWALEGPIRASKRLIRIVCELWPFRPEAKSHWVRFRGRDVAARRGFEPRSEDPKSPVLPLHHRAMKQPEREKKRRCSATVAHTALQAKYMVAHSDNTG